MRWAVKMVVAAVAAAAMVVGSTGAPAFAAKKINACTLVPQAQLESAVGNTFDAPAPSSLGAFEVQCRFPSSDTSGADLNLFLANDVKGGIKNGFRGNFYATQKSFRKVYGSA